MAMISSVKRDARRRMVTTTAKLLQRQGYHGTGINQIVTEAEAPKGSLYFHFPGGKEQLAAEAIAASAAYLDRALLACERPTAAESLDLYVAEAAGMLERSNFHDGCPIATVTLEVGPTSEMIGDACAEAVELMVTRLAGWLERDGFTASVARRARRAGLCRDRGRAHLRQGAPLGSTAHNAAPSTPRATRPPRSQSLILPDELSDRETWSRGDHISAPR